VLFWLTLVVILFEIWYAVAYLVAFVQIRDRALLLQLAQALLLLVGFGHLLLADAAVMNFNPFLFAMLLIGAMLTTIFWRGFPSNLPRLLRSYPRGTPDVLLFRRPKTTDLKRRVRTK